MLPCHEIIIVYLFVSAERLHDFDVWVSDIGPPLPTIINDQYHLCKHWPGHIKSATTETLHCSQSPFGRYVYVSINTSTNANERLTMCELEVVGKYLNLPSSNGSTLLPGY